MKSILFITLFNWIVTVRLIFFVKFIRYQRCDLRRPERKLDYLFIQTKKKTILHILITVWKVESFHLFNWEKLFAISREYCIKISLNELSFIKNEGNF